VLLYIRLKAALFEGDSLTFFGTNLGVVFWQVCFLLGGSPFETVDCQHLWL
jgi:hypothetical protein